MLNILKAEEALYKDIENSRVSHAYMFSSDIDNNTLVNLAEKFARKLIKTDNLKTSLDYKYIVKEEEKTDLTIDQIRKEIINDIYIKPVSSDYKIYVINDAGDMNEKGQNALLKSLEEPPKHVVIIIIKKMSDIMLPTIMSRVKEINIEIEEEADIKKYVLDKYKIELNDNMVEYAKSSFEKADKLGKVENFQMFLTAEKVSKLVSKNSSVDIILLIDKISIKDGAFLDYLENILYYDNHILKLKYIEKAFQRLKQNANEDIIKTIIAIELSK